MTDTLGIDKVKIFQRDVTVDYITNLAGNRGMDGQSIHMQDEIHICPQTNVSHQASILLHEMLHFALDLSKRDLNKEENIEILELVFATLIKDNKEVFKTIIEKL